LALIAFAELRLRAFSTVKSGASSVHHGLACEILGCIAELEIFGTNSSAQRRRKIEDAGRVRALCSGL